MQSIYKVSQLTYSKTLPIVWKRPENCRHGHRSCHTGTDTLGLIGTLVKPRLLMGLLALVMACSTSFMGALQADWSRAACLLVNCSVSLSVLRA